MIEVLKFSIISSLITVAAGVVMWQFSKNDFSFCDVYNEGLELYKKKKFKQALGKFQSALSKYPQNSIAHYNAGLCNLEIKDYENACKNFYNTLQLVPDDLDALYNLGFAYMKLGNYDKATVYFAKLIEAKPNEADALFNIGYIDFMQKKLNNAKDTILKAIDINPSKIEYKRYYFNVLNALNNETPTDEYLNDLLTIGLELVNVYPTDEDLLYKMSVIYAKLGDWEDTIDFCERLYKLNPNSPEGCNQYALALFCKGNIDDAIKMYEHSIEIAPDIPDSYMNLVFAYDRNGQDNAAVVLLKQFLEKFPDNPNVAVANDYLARKEAENTEDIVVTEYVDERGRPISMHKSMSFDDVQRDYADANVDDETDVRD